MNLIVLPTLLSDLAAGLLEEANEDLHHHQLKDLLVVPSPSGALPTATEHFDAGESQEFRSRKNLKLPLQLLLAVLEQVAALEEALDHLVVLRETEPIV